MAEKKLKITLVKSPIGAVPKHRRTVEAMGLSKLHKTVELPDNAATRGQIQQIGYMLKVEEIYPGVRFEKYLNNLKINLIDKI